MSYFVTVYETCVEYGGIFLADFGKDGYQIVSVCGV